MCGCPQQVEITRQTDLGTNYKYSISEFDREFWVDETHGMTPIQYITLRHDEAKEKYMESCHVDWKEIDGVWVPASCRLQETRSGVTVTYSLTLDWKSVNKPLDPVLFTAAGLVRDENVFVVDNRLGKPVIEPAIPILDPVAIAMAARKEAPLGSGNRILWLIFGNAALFGIVFWLWRRRRMRG